MGGFASIPANWAAIASMKSKCALDGFVKELDAAPENTRKVIGTLGQYARDSLSGVSVVGLFPGQDEGPSGA